VKGEGFFLFSFSDDYLVSTTDNLSPITQSCRPNDSRLVLGVQVQSFFEEKNVPSICFL
jgi:hypothetical protein